jgi:AbrB family looped-hinge helix DNA binding protein
MGEIKRTQVKIQADGRIRLPKHILEALGLNPDDTLVVQVRDGSVTLETENPFARWAGRLGGAKSLEEVILWQREMRNEDDAEPLGDAEYTVHLRRAVERGLHDSALGNGKTSDEVKEHFQLKSERSE